MCLVDSSNSLATGYRLSRVSGVKISRNGRVRSVEVTHSTPTPTHSLGELYTGERQWVTLTHSVQRISVIVPAEMGLGVQDYIHLETGITVSSLVCEQDQAASQ